MNTIHQAEIIRTAAHRLLDTQMEVQAVFKADCIRAGKYDHGSPNLNKAIRVGSAVEALVYTHAAMVNGRDVAETLRVYISRENEPSCIPVSAAELLQEVLNEVMAGIQAPEKDSQPWGSK